MEDERIITAKNADIKDEILKCAMYSYKGKIVYRKWNKKRKKYELRSHVVVPIDCGVTVKKNEVLFAQDVEEHMQLKQFIIKQILSFTCLNKKQKPTVDIQLDNIKRMFGIYKYNDPYTTEQQGIAAGSEKQRRLEARITSRIAQEVYEFSGCEGNLYSDKKKTDPCSYDVVYDDGRDGGLPQSIARRIVSALTESQKKMVKDYQNKRDSNLSFGEYFKWDSNGRCYFPLSPKATIQDITQLNDGNTQRIRELIESEGYVCPDYATGYCYEKTDTNFEKRNPPKVLTIVKKALRKKNNLEEGEDAVELYAKLSKSFNERDCGTMKHKGQIKMMLCMTCNPEDIAGMSTDRDWTSCMRLPSKPEEVTKAELKHVSSNDDDTMKYMMYYGLFGQQKTSLADIAKKFNTDENDIQGTIDSINHELNYGGIEYPTALKQVQYGGMVAYLIREDDKNVEHPFARVAIKRLVNDEGGFMFVKENVVYGDSYEASRYDFPETVNRLLEQSNATTMKGNEVYVRKDGASYSDGHVDTYIKDYYKYLLTADWIKVYDLLDKHRIDLTEDQIEEVIKSHRDDPPKAIFGLFEYRMGHDFSEKFLQRHSGQMDMDEYNYSHGIESDVEELYDANAPHTGKEVLSEMKTIADNFTSGEIVEIHFDELHIQSDNNPYSFWSDFSYHTDIPKEIMDYAYGEVDEYLRNYYEDHPNEVSEYPSYLEFFDAFEEGNLDDDLRDEVDNYMWDVIPNEKGINIRLTFSFEKRNEETHEDESIDLDEAKEVFVLKSELVYFYAIDHDKTIYESKTVFYANDVQWEEKLKSFMEDAYSQFPQIM